MDGATERDTSPRTAGHRAQQAAPRGAMVNADNEQQEEDAMLQRYESPERIDYAALLADAEESIAEEAVRLLADGERVLSFVKLIQWDREESLIAAIVTGDAETVGAAVLLRLAELAQECAEEEWMQ